MRIWGHSHEAELMERFRSGDRDAFTAVYRKEHPAVFRFALHMTSDRETATEITQDVFVWLIHNADAFDPGRGELGAFLAGVARKFLQRRWHADRRWVPLDGIPEPSCGPRNGPEVDDSDTLRLRAAIAALPERYREAVVLCDLQENSYEGAAAALGCAVGTVRSRLHRARGLLMRKLRGGEAAGRQMAEKLPGKTAEKESVECPV